MTESKALDFMRLFREDWDRNSKTENAKALDVAIKALEKQIPKKPYYVQYDGNPKIGNPHCSNCCGIISNGGTAKGMHCKWCGQKLDWETEFQKGIDYVDIAK